MAPIGRKGLDNGYFVRPTVFSDVNNEMTIAKEEIFGPVVSIIPFSSEEEAIKISNDTSYGLTNYIQTEDRVKAKRVARQLRSGMVEINGADFADWVTLWRIQTIWKWKRRRYLGT